MVIVPPIKSQGIKTKLVDWIRNCSAPVSFERWVEPFLGTGVVAFNIQPKSALLCDSNPHLIAFYQAIQHGEVTAISARDFLIKEGEKLLNSVGSYYYTIRDRFNDEGNPLDFLFLSRACFNGMMRFNKKGGFNVPFCRKPNRFSKALITKICNQIDAVSKIISLGDYTFVHQEFRDTLSQVESTDLIYCDPPYIGRHVDYFDSWSEDDEHDLQFLMERSGCRFIMSTWFKNKYRHNDYINATWGNYFISTKDHFYHVGAKETNRNAVTEALITNFRSPYAMKISDLNLETVRDDVSRKKDAPLRIVL